MRLNRDRLLIQLLCGGSLVVGCTRLTSVDWSLISSGDSAGTSTGATAAGGEGEPQGGEAGTTSGGAPGAAGEQVGGAAGAAGEENGGSAGTAGTGGSAGGLGGNAGGGAGGSSGQGGLGGNAGTGGNGGNAGNGGSETVVFPPCTGTPSAIQPTDIVMFDGGVGTQGMPRGGRTGLDNSCKAALAQLSLTQSTTHAFISVSQTDSMFGLTTTFPDIPATARVVGPTGIELQSAFSLLKEGHLEQSLVCAGALPMGTTTWLTGSSLACTGALMNECGQFAGDVESCQGWTLGKDDPVVLGRYGSSRMTASIGTKSWFSWLKETCDQAGSEHIVCFAYTP